jgi:cell division protein FtsI/penicillin-binding protein 2
MAGAFQIPSALAYSCNCFVAHFAQRFERGELAMALGRAGLASLPGLLGPREVNGRIATVVGSEANQLQSLGEDSVLITLAGLAVGYRTLALSAGVSEMRPIVEGLESAVEYGTAQLACPDGLKKAGVRIAGKTGSVRTPSGARIAWFAGFAPSRAPEVVVAVMLQGRSGGADAAPVAGRILEAWKAGNI